MSFLKNSKLKNNTTIIDEKGKNMRKIIALLTGFLMTATLFCSHASAVASESDVLSDITYEEEEVCIVSPDLETNFMDIMIQSAIKNDKVALCEAIDSRNDKIDYLKLGYKQLSMEIFLAEFEYYAGFELSKDYLNEMTWCCSNLDVDGGKNAERKRNKKIDASHLDVNKVSFEELLLLSRLITHEFGCSWYPMQWKMMVGEVVLNRVASPEFPNTLNDVIYQRGQYSGVNSNRFKNSVPFDDCIEAAARLLSGERIMNEPSAVYQAAFPQGSGVVDKYYDSVLGSTTYICYSSNRGLY